MKLTKLTLTSVHESGRCGQPAAAVVFGHLNIRWAARCRRRQSGTTADEQNRTGALSAYAAARALRGTHCVAYVLAGHLAARSTLRGGDLGLEVDVEEHLDAAVEQALEPVSYTHLRAPRDRG